MLAKGVVCRPVWIIGRPFALIVLTSGRQVNSEFNPGQDARQFKRNPASGRVLQKVGMTYEGCLRQDVKKWEAFEDMECYGVLRSEMVSHQ